MAMFITVLYGDKESKIFNSNCITISLLNTIRAKCDCSEELEIDVSDESGNIKNLRDYPTRYANELLDEREKLVLVHVERNDYGGYEYVPLLNDSEVLTDEFLTQLASKSSAGFKNNRSARSSRSRASKRNEPALKGKNSVNKSNLKPAKSQATK